MQHSCWPAHPWLEFDNYVNTWGQKYAAFHLDVSSSMTFISVCDHCMFVWHINSFFTHPSHSTFLHCGDLTSIRLVLTGSPSQPHLTPLVTRQRLQRVHVKYGDGLSFICVLGYSWTEYHRQLTDRGIAWPVAARHVHPLDGIREDSRARQAMP